MSVLVEVKLKDDFEREKYVGQCGFYITKGETKMIAIEDYQAQSKALELMKPVEQKAPEPEEPVEEKRKLEPEEDFDLEKEVGDVVDEAKDLITKVRRRGQKKGKR